MTPRLLLFALFVAVCSCSSPTKVTSNAPQTGVAIGGQLSFTAVGQSARLTAFAVLSDGTRETPAGTVTWSVQDPSVATITADGVITIKGFGSTTVTVTNQSFSATAIVHVNQTITALTTSSAVALNAVGQTSQIKAIATLPDGSTQDVSSAATWSSDATTVATVSNSGLVTIAALGVANITASYSLFFSTTAVVATPPGTFAVAGRTRDPGHETSHGNLAGVSIVGPSGQSTTSIVNPVGHNNFFLGGLTDGMMTFDKAGYESASLDTSTVTSIPGVPGKFLDVPMQSVNRIAAGASVNGAIARFDQMLPQGDGSICFPCQLVRVTMPSSGTLHLVLTWSETHSTLNLWVNGVRFAGLGPGPSSSTADAAVSAGDVLVYIGQLNNLNPFSGVTFTLTTSMK